MATRPASTVAVLNRPADGESLTDTVNGLDGDEGTQGSSEGTDTDSGEDATTAQRAPKRNLDEAPDDEVVGITIRVPNGFRKLLAKTALDQKTSVPQMLAQMAAEAFEYTLPTPERAPRIKKYDTPEQRKEAQKTDQRRQRLVAQKVLEAVEKGIVQVDMQAVLAEVDAELKSRAESDAAKAATATAAASATTAGEAS
jgi:hypothetical protein